MCVGGGPGDGSGDNSSSVGFAEASMGQSTSISGEPDAPGAEAGGGDSGVGPAPTGLGPPARGTEGVPDFGYTGPVSQTEEGPTSAVPTFAEAFISVLTDPVAAAIRGPAGILGAAFQAAALSNPDNSSPADTGGNNAGDDANGPAGSNSGGNASGPASTGGFGGPGREGVAPVTSNPVPPLLQPIAEAARAQTTTGNQTPLAITRRRTVLTGPRGILDNATLGSRSLLGA
jgi:hypothetical protein